MNKKFLTGKKILITRAREQSGAFASLLKKLGAEVVEFPTIEIVPPINWKSLDQAIAQLKSYDWIIFTSANGVNFFFERLREKGKTGRLPRSLRVCAIGPATAYQLKERGIRVDYIPKEFVAEAILKGFRAMTLPGRRILLARAKGARDVLPQGLRKMGAEIDVVDVYRTVKPRGGAKRLRQLLTDGGIDAITFTSSSTVNHFAELLKKEELKKLLDGIAVACIGPITARTAKGWGMRVRIRPKEYTIPALTLAIADFFSSQTPRSSSLSREERVG
jgi:uroporphyrinogen III methyltransferase/synthase